MNHAKRGTREVDGAPAQSIDDGDAVRAARKRSRLIFTITMLVGLAGAVWIGRPRPG